MVFQSLFFIVQLHNRSLEILPRRYCTHTIVFQMRTGVCVCASVAYDGLFMMCGNGFLNSRSSDIQFLNSTVLSVLFLPIFASVFMTAGYERRSVSNLQVGQSEDFFSPTRFYDFFIFYNRGCCNTTGQVIQWCFSFSF